MIFLRESLTNLIKVNGLLREKCLKNEQTKSLSEGIASFRIIYIISYLPQECMDI